MTSLMIALVAAAMIPQGPVLPSQSTSLALAYEAGIVAGPSLLISVPEDAQGHTDLNGDGDAFDRIVHTIDLDSGLATNLGIVGDWLAASDFIGVIEEYEGWQGIDLDGDGDLNDYVYKIHDVETGITRLLPWAVGHGFFQSISIDRRRVSFLVSELDHGGMDLNIDGDADDLVAFVHDARSGATANLQLAARATGVADGLVAIAVDEFGQGQDLDGNGAVNGLVLSVLRSNALVVENTQVPILLTNFGASLRVQHGAVLVETDESLFPAGGMDLNADGDVTDPVSVLWDVRARRMINLGLALEPGQQALLQPDAVWVPVAEGFQGNQDLNGDGDAVDQVLHRVALPGYAVANLARATVASSLRADAGRCAFGVVEWQQGTDLNGDLDLNDLVMHILRTGARGRLQHDHRLQLHRGDRHASRRRGLRGGGGQPGSYRPECRRRHFGCRGAVLGQRCRRDAEPWTGHVVEPSSARSQRPLRVDPRERILAWIHRSQWRWRCDRSTRRLRLQPHLGPAREHRAGRILPRRAQPPRRGRRDRVGSRPDRLQRRRGRAGRGRGARGTAAVGQHDVGYDFDALGERDAPARLATLVPLARRVYAGLFSCPPPTIAQQLPAGRDCSSPWRWRRCLLPCWSGASIT